MTQPKYQRKRNSTTDTYGSWKIVLEPNDAFHNAWLWIVYDRKGIKVMTGLGKDRWDAFRFAKKTIHKKEGKQWNVRQRKVK